MIGEDDVPDPRRYLIVERKHVEEYVDWGLLPPGPRLTVAFNLFEICGGHGHTAGQRRKDFTHTLSGDKNVDVQISRASRLARAEAESYGATDRVREPGLVEGIVNCDEAIDEDAHSANRISGGYASSRRGWYGICSASSST